MSHRKQPRRSLVPFSSWSSLFGTGQRRRETKRLRFETLERREVLSINPLACFAFPDSATINIHAVNIHAAGQAGGLYELPSTVEVISFQNGVNGYGGTRDTMIQSGSNKSAGSVTGLFMDGGPDAAALLAWDLSSIPAGSVVDSVRLDLYVTNSSKVAYSAYGLLQSWTNDATWAATGTGSSWSTAGAQGSADRGLLVGQLSAPKNGATSFSFNAGGLAMVQSWIDNPDTNFGIIFQDYSSSDGVIVASSEASNISQRPWLTITYHTPTILPPNTAPTVDAGPNRSATHGTAVSLSGSVADDGQPNLVNSNWTRVSGPGMVTFGNAQSPTTTAQFSAPGTYVLRLTASDGALSSSDDVTVVINPDIVNLAPQVEAGGNQTIYLGSVAQLNGIATDDGAGIGLTTLWSRISGPGSVTFGTPASLSSTVQFSQPGTHVLRLTASNGFTSSSDTLTITVEGVNQSPQVNAGPNLTMNVGASLSLDATVTDDGLPGSLTTQWVVLSGPGNVQFADASRVDTSVTFSQAGTYILRLSASDGVLFAHDEITVTVLNLSTPITAEFQQGVDGYTGTRDTEIRSSAANNNLGKATSMSMDGKPDSAVLLGWDVSTIPTGSVIVSASIELFVTNGSRDTFNVYALDRAWDELSATWLRASSSVFWSSLGAQGNGDLASLPVGQVTGRSIGTTAFELNELGLAMIQSWIDDPQSNHGLIFQNYGAGDGLDIASSEVSQWSRRPKLKLEFAPIVVPHNTPEEFFSTVEETTIGQEQAIYPYGPNMAFGLYSVSGMNDYDPTKSNMQRVAEEGFNLVGPYNSKNWETDLSLIHQAHGFGLDFIYMVRQHPSLAGVAVANRPAAISLLSDAEIAAYARTQVEAILNDPVARETVKFWTTQPDEIRYWIAEEMRYLRIATETIRQVEVERGEAHRPIWSYEPNHRPADQMVLTGQYQDVVSRGAYFTTRFDRGTDRAGWAMWSYQQIVEAANTLGNIPQAVFELLQDFTDPTTAGSVEEITRVIRHDVYLSLVMGIKGLNVFSMYEDRPNLTTHNEQFEAYGTIAKDLLGELDLDRVLLAGQEMADLNISVASGPTQFDYLHNGTTPYTFDFLNYRHLAIGDERYVFLVNSAESPMEVLIEGLPNQYIVDDLFAGTSTTSGGNMAVGLDLLGVKVLRFRQA